MDVKILKKEKSTVELTIEATPEELSEHEERALKQLSAELKLPGFRPGKVPTKIAKQHLDPAKLLAATADLAIPRLYAKAVLDNNIEAIGTPQIQVTKVAPGNPFIFKATVGTLPEFKSPDYKNLKVERKQASVSDDQVDRLIRNVREQRATESPVERPAKEGDAVEIDFDLKVDNVPLEHGQGRKHPLVIGKGTFIPGFEEQLIGVAKDGEKDFKLTFPKDYGKKNVAGKEAEAHVKMLSVKERKLPEVDDAFAKLIGKFENLADMKKQLKDNLKLEEDQKELERYESEVLSTLADQTEMEIPDPLLQGELDKMARELEQSLTKQGANFQDYLTSIGKSIDDLKKGWVDQAKKRIKIGLVLRRVAKDEALEVTDADVEEEVNATLKQAPGNKEIEETVKGKPYQDYLKEVIRNRKTIKLLSSWADGSQSEQATNTK